MSQFTHKCIKCQTAYKSDEVDPYYCDSCNEERKAIALEIDKKMANVVSKRTYSALKEYDETPKIHGFIHVKL